MQRTSLKPAFLATRLGNETQVWFCTSTHCLRIGGAFSSFSVQHSRSDSNKTANEGTIGEGSRCRLNLLSLRQVLAESACYPYFTHLTLSSSDIELLTNLWLLKFQKIITRPFQSGGYKTAKFFQTIFSIIQKKVLNKLLLWYACSYLQLGNISMWPLMSVPTYRQLREPLVCMQILVIVLFYSYQLLVLQL